MLSGKHSIPEEISSFDQVKKSFTGRMKLTQMGQFHKCRKTFFHQQGWALPIRKKFKFSIKQKNLLYDYFMQRETSGKKLSPDQVLAKNLISMWVMQ